MSTERREGGIGGKLRARQPRRAPATPYDRPAAAARGLRGARADTAEEAQGSWWLSKLVDPASALVTKGATRLLSSVFQKRLGDPPAEESLVASFGARQASPDISDNTTLPDIQKDGSRCRGDLRNHSNGDGISELEQLLKQKTFTRAEYDHLMELLHSQTVDVPKEEENRIEPTTLLPAGDYKKQKDENLPPQEGRIESSKSVGITSIPGPTLEIPEEELASPAEVAKAYMGSRSSKVSPSSLCLRSQMLREATTSPSFIGFAPKSSAAHSRSIVCFSGVPGTPGDGYMTPMSRGRSSIYKMSCSPFFKGRAMITVKDSEAMEGGYPGPSMSTQTPTNIALSSGKQVLKRRSSVLESDLGPVGSMRRIRQKSNLMSPSEAQFPGKLLPPAKALDVVQRSSPSIQRHLPLHQHKYITSDMKAAENQEETGGYASVALQTREMAKKILQQLDVLVPSPRGESTEAKTIFKDESPSKSTLDTLHGRALKSVAKIDATRLFTVEGNGKLDGSSNFLATGRGDSVSPMKGKAENSHSKATFSEAKMVSEAKGVGSLVTSIAEIKPVMGCVDSVFLDCTASPLQKFPAFKMQAPEGSPEKGDGSYGRSISGPSSAGKEKVEMNGHKSAISETAVIKKTFASSSESMPGSNIQLSEAAGKEVSDEPTVADKDTGFMSQVSLSHSTQCQAPLTPIMPSLPVDEPVPLSGQNAVPLFTFGTRSTPLIFSSSMMTYSDSAGHKFGASSSTAITATTAPVKCAVSDEAGKTQKAGHLLKSGGTSSSFGLSMPTASSSFQFVASATSSQSNGSLTSNSSILSVSSATASFISGSLAGAVVSPGPATVCSSSSEPSSSLAFCVLPSAQFGTSSSSIFTDSTVPTSLDLKLIKDSSFGNNSSSAAVSSIVSSPGSNIFGLPASASSSAPTFGSSAKPVFVSQTFRSGSRTSAEGTSQFGSAASPTFGLASSSFGFSSSAFGPSISNMKPFGSSSGFGQSSTLSSPGAACSSTSSNSSFAPTVITQRVFGSSSQSTVSSIFSSVFDSASSSSVSAFGISPASSATTFGSSSSSMSQFSVSSSAVTSPSAFSFTQATTTSSSAFSVTFGATTTSAPHSLVVSGSPGIDQMNVEDSMADDMVEAPTPVIPTFGQRSSIPSQSLPFGSAPTPSGAPGFQFASSLPSAFPSTRTPFQAAGSFEFGRNFSMGSGGGDTSGRRFIKAKRDKHRKK